MPNVNGKKFPYTEKGKAEAAAAMAGNPKFLKPSTGKPAIKPQAAAIAAMRKKQASR